MLWCQAGVAPGHALKLARALVSVVGLDATLHTLQALLLAAVAQHCYY
jgi:hypothetical protein